MRPPAPSPLAWFAAGISLMVSLGGAIFLGYLFLIAGRSVSYHELQRSLALADLGRAERYVGILHARPSPVYSILTTPFKGLSRYLLNERSTLLSAMLLKIQGNLREGELNTAETLSRDAAALALEEGESVTRASRAVVAPRLEEIASWIREIMESRERSQVVEREISTLVDGEGGLQGRYVLLQRDVADLFSFPPPRDPSDELLFYEEGYLAGLPRIPELEDGLADANSLRMELDRKGGSVKLQGPGSAQLFQDRLAELRERTDELLSDIKESERKRVFAEDERAHLIDERARLTSQTERTLQLLTLETTRPPTPLTIEAALALLHLI